MAISSKTKPHITAGKKGGQRQHLKGGEWATLGWEKNQSGKRDLTLFSTFFLSFKKTSIAMPSRFGGSRCWLMATRRFGTGKEGLSRRRRFRAARQRRKLVESSLTVDGSVSISLVLSLFPFFCVLVYWFTDTRLRTGNTRVISQNALDHFRESLAKRQADPYSVVLKQNKLPMSLLDEASKVTLVSKKRGRI
jgi:hypothetical protein